MQRVCARKHTIVHGAVSGARTHAACAKPDACRRACVRERIPQRRGGGRRTIDRREQLARRVLNEHRQVHRRACE